MNSFGWRMVTVGRKPAVVCDERTEVIQGQNCRISYTLVIVALFVDVFYRAEFLGQTAAQLGNTLAILVGALVVQLGLDLIRGGTTRGAFQRYAVLGAYGGTVLYAVGGLVRGLAVVEVVIRAGIYLLLLLLIIRIVSGVTGWRAQVSPTITGPQVGDPDREG